MLILRYLSLSLFLVVDMVLYDFGVCRSWLGWLFRDSFKFA